MCQCFCVCRSIHHLSWHCLNLWWHTFINDSEILVTGFLGEWGRFSVKFHWANFCTEIQVQIFVKKFQYRFLYRNPSKIAPKEYTILNKTSPCKTAKKGPKPENMHEMLPNEIFVPHDILVKHGQFGFDPEIFIIECSAKQKFLGIHCVAHNFFVFPSGISVLVAGVGIDSSANACKITVAFVQPVAHWVGGPVPVWVSLTCLGKIPQIRDTEEWKWPKLDRLSSFTQKIGWMAKLSSFTQKMGWMAK